MKKFPTMVLVLSLVTLPLMADSGKVLVSAGKNGLALQGYDPVAFFTENRPVKGRPDFKSSFRGVTYLFASSENKMRFEKEPSRYEPAFGGFCAYGVSRNKLVGIDPEAFQIVDGRLLLQYSKSVRNDFNKDVQGNLAKANTNWPTLLEKKGK